MTTTKKKVQTEKVKTKSPIESAKKKAINIALEQIEKDFGKGSIMKLGSKEKVNIEVIPTGALSLDIALGVGGIPKGRIIEISIHE